MWYFLESKINKKETYVELNGSYDKLTSYFFSNIENKKDVDNMKFSGIAQKGFTYKLLSQTDYLVNARFGGIPIFSERFMKKTSQYLSDKIDFHLCKILLNEKSCNFYLGKIKHILPIIDYEKSGYRQLANGHKILSEPTIIKEDIDEKLLIIRDSTYKSIFVVSDLFKQIIEKEKLKIGFYNTTKTFW